MAYWLPQAKHGIPCYMAPELFQDGEVHSYASDFWALGCVIYECYTGRPPFVGKEFTQLAKSILLDATPALSATPTRAFEILINSFTKAQLKGYSGLNFAVMLFGGQISPWVTRILDFFIRCDG